LKRHENLTHRFAENIETSGAAVEENESRQYFETLKCTLEGVPPENFVNFDETNFTEASDRRKS